MTPTPIPFPVPVIVLGDASSWWMVWLTAAGIVVTATIAVLTLIANRRADASRAVADKAQTTALQAYVQALNLSQAASDRQVEVLEALVDRVNQQAGPMPAEGQPVSPEAKSGVSWLLMHDLTGKHRWNLQNAGDRTAYQVSLAGETEQDSRDLMIMVKDPIDLDPYQSVPFAIWRSLASPPATIIVVKWRDENGSEYSTRIVVA
ncbi:hypothetical protein P0L94_07115 [Microbacter sp. GSS18]|nr:hypothetical protein P0L94_07115 [Microbacter sp. GSS18]